MSALLSIFVLGTIWGAIYSLIAVGFTLILGVAGIVNLAHGAFYMIGAYLAYTFMSILKLNVVLSALLAVAGVAVIGMILDQVGIRPFRENHAYQVVLTLIFGQTFCRQVIYAIYGAHGKSVQNFINGDIELAGMYISYQKLLIICAAIIVVSLLWIFIKKTKIGKSISAVEQNKVASILMGIRYERVYMITMGISAALAALAGVLASPIIEAEPGMSSFPLFKAFAIVVIGGLGSMGGAIIVSLLLAYSETAVSYLLSANYADMVYLTVMILILVVRPTGILKAGRMN
jgi:branched-chain amino acid transport system permease protein